MGHVYVPDNQPPALDPGCCDPIAIDNFLQVSGIHVNCLWDCRDDEVFVCTAIRQILFSERFMNKTKDKRSWIVYSNFELNTNGQVINDIFDLEPDTGKLVLALMGTAFTRLPFKLLSKTLAKLNNFQPQDQPLDSKGQREGRSIPHKSYEQADGLSTPSGQEVSDVGGTVPVVDETQTDQDGVLEELKGVLSEVLEVSTKHVHPDSALADLGVDSLMATEVVNEIKGRFGVAISNAEFQDLTDIQSLCWRLRPRTSMPASDACKESRVVQNPCDILPPNNTHRPNKPVSMTPDDRSNRGLATSGPDCFAKVKKAIETAAKETGFNGFCRNVYPFQADLVLTYVVEAFAALGCPLASLRPGQRLPDIHYSPKHGKVVAQFYKIPT